MKKMEFITIIGTRPEVIKLFPVIKTMNNYPEIDSYIVSTRQQNELLELSLKEFEISPNIELKYDGNLDLPERISKILVELSNVISKRKPNVIIVQGDTTTAFLGSFVGFLNRIPVAHIEAGLRSGNRLKPFPEEIFRQLISRLSTFNFAPTEEAKLNLMREGIDKSTIYVVGNPIIETLETSIKKIEDYEVHLPPTLIVTLHRRENFENAIREVCLGVNKFIKSNEEVKVIFFAHSNPTARKVIKENLELNSRVRLQNPTSHFEFINVLLKSFCILTDSGGVQEESYILGKKLLIARTETERPEVLLGDTQLVELKSEEISRSLEQALTSHRLNHNKNDNKPIINLDTELGNGTSSKQIMDILYACLKSYG